ncbi:MAG: hypothetical protein ACK4RN_16850 [Pseudorhodobacter sp.]
MTRAHRFTPFISLILLTGCAGLGLPNPFSGGSTATPIAESEAVAAEEVAELQPVVAIRPSASARTAAQLDTTSEADKAAARAVTAAPELERALGRVSVALGNATEPGFWLRSSLVSERAQGRVVTALGESLQVDLLPGEGSAQLSLAAFRALNLPLTGLPEVTVFRR